MRDDLHLLTHVLCKQTHFFFHFVIATCATLFKQASIVHLQYLYQYITECKSVFFEELIFHIAYIDKNYKQLKCGEAGKTPQYTVGHLVCVTKLSNLTRGAYRVQVANALSQETRIKSGVPQGSVFGPLIFFLSVNYLPSVTNVTALLFTDYVKKVSPCSQSDLLQGSLYNVWNWLVNWDLPINPTKCNYIAIGRAPPLQLSPATGSLGDSIHVTNVNKDLGILMDNSFSLSIHF